MKQDNYTKNVSNLPSRFDRGKRTGCVDIFYTPQAQNLKRCIVYAGVSGEIPRQEAHQLISALGLKDA